jgi:hypothetical protein
MRDSVGEQKENIKWLLNWVHHPEVTPAQGTRAPAMARRADNRQASSALRARSAAAANKSTSWPHVRKTAIRAVAGSSSLFVQLYDLHTRPSGDGARDGLERLTLAAGVSELV